MNEYFVELKENDNYEINGGGFLMACVGYVVGAIYGAGVGSAVAIGAIVSGNEDRALSCFTGCFAGGALLGVAIGTFVPTP